MVVVMNSKLKLICFATLVLLFFNAVSSADLLFQMTATKNTLAVGEEVTIGIWANIEEQTTGLNGLNLWQLDMVADVPSVVKVKTDGTKSGTEINFIAPSPRDLDGTGWTSINKDLDANVFEGNVLGLGATIASMPDDSDTGVGGFTLLVEVTIEGIAPGTVEYNLVDALGVGGGFYGVLRDYFEEGPTGNYYDIMDGNLRFVSGNNVFTVVPEPASVVLFAIASAFALRRRK
ncbi:MAG: PEP-CTERM sorting domain-containing protein [Sedimentisphaerales bacterium]